MGPKASSIIIGVESVIRQRKRYVVVAFHLSYLTSDDLNQKYEERVNELVSYCYYCY